MRQKMLIMGLSLLSLSLLLYGNVQVQGQSTDSKAGSSSGAGLFRAGGATNPTCLDNYSSWPNSTTYKADSTWSTTFMHSGPNNGVTSLIHSLQDLNGDGLPDYIYANKVSDLSSATTAVAMSEFSCVYLNNGHGWDLAYRCVTIPGSPNRYYGNCAG